MIDINYTTNVSTESGVFFQKDVGWEFEGFSGPIKTTPMDCVSEHGGIANSERDIAELYVSLTPVDLEAYRSGEDTADLQKIEKQSNAVLEDEISVLFIKYSETTDISSTNMETLLEIQKEHADVLTNPIQPTLFDAISPFIDQDYDLDNPPMIPYNRSLERFFEAIENTTRPVMGILPPVVFKERGREIQTYYEQNGITWFAYDFRGLKATTDRIYSEIKDLLVDMGTRRQAEQRVLYALNYKPYHVNGNDEIIPSEAVLLAGSGFDIIGGTHKYRGGGDGGRSDTIKIMNPNSFGFDPIPFEKLVSKWKVNSTIPPEVLEEVGKNKQREMRKIINGEQLSRTFRKLRAAIEEGDAGDLLADKEGLPARERDRLEGFASSYTDATSPNVFGDFA